MVYTFVCDDCNLDPIDVYRLAANAGDPEICQSCNKPMRKIFYPVANTYKSVHDSPAYNPAFGKVIQNKAHLQEELRRVKGETGRELIEVGNEKFPDNFAPQQKSYDDDIVDRIKI